MKRWMRAWPGLVVVLAAGCAGGPEPVPLPDAATDDTAIRVVVRNHHPQTMLVYAHNGTMRTQIGTVESDASVVFRVPDSMLMEGDAWVLHFSVGVFGGRQGFRTDDVVMRRGDEISLRIAAPLHRSTWSK